MPDVCLRAVRPKWLRHPFVLLYDDSFTILAIKAAAVKSRRAIHPGVPPDRASISRELAFEAQVAGSNKTAVALLPRPSLLAFVASSDVFGGSDGIRTRDLSLDRAAC